MDPLEVGNGVSVERGEFTPDIDIRRIPVAGQKTVVLLRSGSEQMRPAGGAVGKVAVDASPGGDTSGNCRIAYPSGSMGAVRIIPTSLLMTGDAKSVLPDF
jgi:hypothetical protein